MENKNKVMSLHMCPQNGRGGFGMWRCCSLVVNRSINGGGECKGKGKISSCVAGASSIAVVLRLLVLGRLQPREPLIDLKEDHN